ncbi:MAG: HPF/RaiA family ribosome-associated protein [Candidatus Omnitrophica bacterium]|nr:HPF/RaiA family ribosome-associated protein [Candidatus Omnitrophota bacterium]
MEVPLELVLRNVENQKEIEAVVYEKLEKLEQVCDHVISCRVLVEQNPTHQHAKFSYHIRIDVRVPPHHEIVVKRDSGRNVHENLSTILREAFIATRRQVEQIVERQKLHVKAHTKEKMIPAKLRKVLKSQE